MRFTHSLIISMAVIFICHMGTFVRAQSWFAKKTSTELKSTKNSTKTNLILQKDPVTGAQLEYTFFTMQKKYMDAREENFLIGEITLKDLPTQHLFEDYDPEDDRK